MASTTFVDGDLAQSNRIVAEWLNDVNRLNYTIFANAATVAAARTAIGLGTGDSPTFTGATFSGLSASSLVATDANKALTSTVSGLSPTFTGLTLTGDLAVNGGDLTTTATTFNLLNVTATTINFGGGASTALNIGHASGTNTILGATSFSQLVTAAAALTVSSGALTVTGGIVTTGSTTSLTLRTTAGTWVTISNAGLSAFAKLTAGDVATFTNQAASNKTLFVYSDASSVSIGDTAGQAGNALAIVPGTNTIQVNIGGALNTSFTAVGQTIGTTATRSVTQPTNSLSLSNGTAPAGTASNLVTLYAAAGKLWAMDAAGAATQLTP